METSAVRQRVLLTIDRAKRRAAERREQGDEAARDYGTFLERLAVPLFRQVAGALKAEGYAYQIFTPSGAVRLMSESRSEDYVGLSLDTSGQKPVVMGTARRNRGGRVIETERPIGDGAVRDLTEEDVLDFLLTELEPFVEK